MYAVNFLYNAQLQAKQVKFDIERKEKMPECFSYATCHSEKV